MKQRSRLLGYLVSLVLIVTWPLSAQQPPAQQSPAMPPTQPPGQALGPEPRHLAFLVGAWQEKVKYPAEAADQKDEEGTGRWFARPVLGRFLQFNYEGATPQGPYRALGMLTYDREAQNYRLLWFDDMGGVGDYRGNFTDQNTLSLEHHSKVEGRDFRERISFTRVSPGEVRTRIEQAWDVGAYHIYLEADATRIGPPPQGPPRAEPPLAKPPAN